jgi:hypothetical protein
MASSETARRTSVIRTSINVKPFLLCNEFNLTPPCPLSKNKNRIVVLIKPRQSGRIDLLRQPGCPLIRDPWLSPPAPSLAQRASHRVRRAGVPRLLVVWLYRVSIFFVSCQTKGAKSVPIVHLFLDAWKYWGKSSCLNEMLNWCYGLFSIFWGSHSTFSVFVAR